MRHLSSTGQQALQDIAQRNGVSFDATLSLFDAVLNGNGSMAQFNHPEFGGYGQWMRGGMTMVSDLFDHSLKARVDRICIEISELIARQPGLTHSGSFQSQSQGDGSGRDTQTQAHHAAHAAAQDSSDAHSDTASLFASPGPDWWGPSLKWPNSTGAQNDMRYAYFAQAQRLAIEQNGRVTIYDTLDHQIGGFSQQQSSSGTMRFNSQQGLVDVGSLPVVSVDGVASPASQRDAPNAGAPEPSSSAASSDVFATIQKLAELHGQGILSDAEFQAKKTELLGRL